MTVLLLKITDKTYIYGRLQLEENEVREEKPYGFALNDQDIIKKIRIGLDCVFIHYLIKELKLSEFYSNRFVSKWLEVTNRLIVILKPTKYDLIDYRWNNRVYMMVRERCELDHILSWLSTLGGAFSALGDYFPNCAHIAGKISINQLKLALRLGDETIAARCRLFISLSLIQKKKFKCARRIVHREYYLAKCAAVVDHRLLNMCHGIWSKLQYEHWVFRKCKSANIW